MWKKIQKKKHNICAFAICVLLVFTGISCEKHDAAANWRNSFPDANNFVAEKNAALFEADVKMWYTYPEGTAEKGKDNIEFPINQNPEHSILISDMCTWNWADNPQLPKESGRISIGSDDSSCFTFLLDSDIVVFTDGDGTAYLTAHLDREQVYGDYDTDHMSENILQIFSSYEFGRCWYRLVEGTFDTGDEIVEAYFKELTDYLKSMTPDNLYAVADVRLLDYSIEQETDDTLIFCADYAVKPENAEYLSFWISGNAAYGTGEWDGYVINSISISLSLEGGVWVVRGAGTEVSANG